MPPESAPTGALTNDQERLRRYLMGLCLVVYFGALGVLILEGAEAQIRAVIRVEYPLGVYCAIVMATLYAMFRYADRVPIAQAQGGRQ